MTKAVSACILAASLLTTAGCIATKESYVSKGNKLFAAGKYADAVLNYRKAIQKDPTYGEGYYRLGLAELKFNNPGEAQKALMRAVQLLPNNIDAKEKLGSLTLQYYFVDPHRSQSYYNVVRQMSDELLAKNPSSFEGLREKAYLALTDQRIEEAILLFRKALQANPSDGTVTVALAQNLNRNGQSKEAESLALGFLSRQKSYGPIYDLLYELYSAGNRPVEAENMLKAKVNANPTQAAYVLDLAAHYFRLQRSAEMQATLQRLLDNSKDFPQARLSVGDFYLKARAYPEAIRYYQEGARSAKADERIEYLKRTVNALEAAGKMEEATGMVAQILKEKPTDEEARRIQAYLLLNSSNAEKVAAAEREFQNLSNEKVDDASVWLGLGRARELKGDLEAARMQFQEALKKRSDYLPARYALAEIALLQKQPDKTLQQADEILKILPNDRRAKLLRAQALVRTGNSATARAELTNLTKGSGNEIQPQLELGLLALSEQKYRDAEEIFDKLRPSGDPRAVAGRAMSYSAQKQYDKAIEILTEGLKKSPGSGLLVSQLAKTAALGARYDLAITQFRKLLSANPKAGAEWLRLGDVYMLKGDDNNAVLAYREAFNLSPKDLNSGLALAKALAGAGRANEARAQFQALLNANPDNAFAQNEMAFFLSQNDGNLDEALRLAQRALAKMPGQPNFSDTVACIYLKKGLSDSAIQVFSNLVQKYPKYPTFHYHLGMAWLEKGDKSRAKKELDAALDSHPSRQDQARIKELLIKIG